MSGWTGAVQSTILKGPTGPQGLSGYTGPTGPQGSFFTTLSVRTAPATIVSPTSFTIGSGGSVITNESLSLQTNGLYLQLGTLSLVADAADEVDVGLSDAGAVHTLYMKLNYVSGSTSQVQLYTNAGLIGSSFTFSAGSTLSLYLDGISAYVLLNGTVAVTISYTFATTGSNPLFFFVNSYLLNPYTFPQVLFYPTGLKGPTGLTGADSSVTGPTGPQSTVTGPTGTFTPIGTGGTGYAMFQNPDDGLFYTNSSLQIAVSSATQQIQASADFVPAAHLTYNLGQSGMAWNSIFVGPGSLHIGGATISATGTNLVLQGNIQPASSNTQTLGSTGLPWKELYMGPGTLNIIGASGGNATLGSDQNGIAYAQQGFATPFINIGPSISAIDDPGAIGGWVVGPTGTLGDPGYDLIAQQKLPGAAVPAGLTGPVYSLINRQGSTGSTGPTGPTGAAGINGVSGGLTFYLDSAGGTVTAGNPSISSLPLTPNLGAQTTISYVATGVNNVLVGKFTTPVGALSSTVVPPGLWDLNIFAAVSNVGSAPSFYYSIFQVDADGVSNPISIASGSNEPVLITNLQSSQLIYDVPLYVPYYLLTDSTKRIQLQLFVNGVGSSRTAYFEFRSGAVSHLHTTLAVTPGPTGNTGPTGSTGSTGPTGPAASDALAWTTYTPTWTADGTAPAINNGTLTGRYKIIGKSVLFNIRVLMGTTTTYGSGNWQFGLPVDAQSGTNVVVPATYLHDGVGWYYGIANNGYLGGTSNITPLYGSTTVIPITPTNPFTWGASDTIAINGTYESV